VNPVGIQYLSEHLDRQLFPSKTTTKPTKEEQRLIDISKDYLSKHGLLGKKTAISEPVSFDIPELQGNNLDEHFRRLALFAAQSYLDSAKHLASSSLPERPNEFLFQSGWYKYVAGQTPVPVEYPEGEALVFDVETLYKVSHYPIMATAATEDAWYGWVSPKLTGESDSFEHLIPLNTLKQERVIVGHNVSYDRSRVKEEYNLKESKAFFLDTMALHIAVSGMCSQQRIKWMEHRKLKNSEDIEEDALRDSEISDPWVNYSSPNSLADVTEFYFNQKVDKTIRDTFSADDIQVIRDDFQNLIGYCAKDVSTTHMVYSRAFPQFLKDSPHPVSFAALKFMGTGILPTNQTWEDYLNSAETLYQESRQKIEGSLSKLAEEAVRLRNDPEAYMNDPWLRQLNWKCIPLKFKKNGEPYKKQKLPGYPEWYKELYDTKSQRLKITTRARITPLLLKLKWEGYPVVWNDHYGWCFEAPSSDYEILIKKNYIEERDFLKTLGTKKPTKKDLQKASSDAVDMKSSLEKAESDVDSFMSVPEIPENLYFRVPNSVGPLHRTSLLLSKSFSNAFEKGVLNSDNPVAQQALQMNASCSYWISARQRIMSQFVVYKNKNYSLILPQVLTMGTITRRAVEKTWLTASNAKKSRIGSELKSKIIAPPGYCFVGADVDSEELWIASLVGDAMFKMHGATAIGWMTLEGSKNEGTDLHSKTAKILGIGRGEAKVFNYGRIYGAGVKFATTLLKRFNPDFTDEECIKRAHDLYAETKGHGGRYYINKIGKKLWYGGSESVLFNELERIAQQDHPRTPILGASITKALMAKYLNVNSFLPSRVNWAIQSSGVDYLHLLCVSMNYLIKKYSINARLCLSVHDEIRYLVDEKDKYRAAMALQISNIWTRAIFSENLGMKDLPQSCAFFSAVDIDHVLRKEVDMDCVTPSNPSPISPGESLDITQLLSKPESDLGKGKDFKLKKTIALELPDEEIDSIDEDDNFSLSNPRWKETYLKMQTTDDKDEFRLTYKRYREQVRSMERQRRFGYDDKFFDMANSSVAVKQSISKIKSSTLNPKKKEESSNLDFPSSSSAGSYERQPILSGKPAGLHDVLKELSDDNDVVDRSIANPMKAAPTSRSKSRNKTSIDPELQEMESKMIAKSFSKDDIESLDERRHIPYGVWDSKWSIGDYHRPFKKTKAGISRYAKNSTIPRPTPGAVYGDLVDMGTNVTPKKFPVGEVDFVEPPCDERGDIFEADWIVSDNTPVSRRKSHTFDVICDITHPRYKEFDLPAAFSGHEYHKMPKNYEVDKKVQEMNAEKKENSIAFANRKGFNSKSMDSFFDNQPRRR
jgi:DNA polymerase gamma 1